MVTYSLRCVCGGRTMTLVPQIVRRPYGFYANLTATSWFLARHKVIASLAFFLIYIKLFQKPQCRNHTARSPYGGRAIALRWPWGGMRFLPCLGCLVNRTAASRRPHGALTAAVRQTCGSCNNREVAVRSPPGLLAVTLRFLISWIVRSPCGRCIICDHKYRSPHDLTILKNHLLQTVDRRTVRRPYGGSMICDRGISKWNLFLCAGLSRRQVIGMLLTTLSIPLWTKIISPSFPCPGMIYNEGVRKNTDNSPKSVSD